MSWDSKILEYSQRRGAEVGIGKANIVGGGGGGDDRVWKR